MATQMTKAQLVSELAERTDSDKKSASAMLDALTGIHLSGRPDQYHVLI